MKKLGIVFLIVLFLASLAQAQTWKFIITSITADTTTVGADSISGSFNYIVNVLYYKAATPTIKYPHSFQFPEGYTKNAALAIMQQEGAKIARSFERLDSLKIYEGDTINIPDSLLNQ